MKSHTNPPLSEPLITMAATCRGPKGYRLGRAVNFRPSLPATVVNACVIFMVARSVSRIPQGTASQSTGIPARRPRNAK